MPPALGSHFRSDGFTCQIYTEAQWCTADGREGAGWCRSDHSSCLMHDTAPFSWGVIGDFAMSAGVSALDACAGCGAPCTPAPSTFPNRTLNELSPTCTDLRAHGTRPWRDAYGYTCGAYHHGQFCRHDPANGTWSASWDASQMGRIEQYAWWAQRDGQALMLSAFDVCCT
jgi:hypothetical protein